MKLGTEISPFCVYTIVHSEKLKEILAQGRSGKLIESKPWIQASRLLDKAKSAGQKMPILFSAAEDTSGLLYYAFLADIELGSDSTAYSFTGLSPISNPPPKTSLKLKQTGQNIHRNFIRPYAICHTPALIPKLLHPSSSSENPIPTLNRNSTETARYICDTLLPNKTLQRFVLGELFRSIRHLPPSLEKLRWGLTLARTYIRLNVGPLEAFIISESEVGLLLYETVISDALRSQLRRFRTVHYKALPRAIGVWMDHHHFLETAVSLRHEHDIFLNRAIAGPRRPGFYKAHSPGLMQYLTLQFQNPAVSLSVISEDQLERVNAEDAEEEVIKKRTDIGPTSKFQLSRARRGQGIFRRNVCSNETACRVTGVKDLKHLRASHIKPWVKSTDEEKLNGCNGLLLAPHIDHLFDEGWISFEDNGDIMISHSLDLQVLCSWVVPTNMNVGRFNAAQTVFLEYHRKNEFERWLKA